MLVSLECWQEDIKEMARAKKIICRIITNKVEKDVQIKIEREDS